MNKCINKKSPGMINAKAKKVKLGKDIGECRGSGPCLFLKRDLGKPLW